VDEQTARGGKGSQRSAVEPDLHSAAGIELVDEDGVARDRTADREGRLPRVRRIDLYGGDRDADIPLDGVDGAAAIPHSHDHGQGARVRVGVACLRAAAVAAVGEAPGYGALRVGEAGTEGDRLPANGGAADRQGHRAED